MFRGRSNEQTGVLVSREPATHAEIGEHEALARLQEARGVKIRAVEATKTAERLMIDADEALGQARREVRRASER